MDEKLEFKINQFEGPLDLLLHLIDKNKFNIFDIPIVEITEQYLDYLNRMQEENLDHIFCEHHVPDARRDAGHGRHKRRHSGRDSHRRPCAGDVFTTKLTRGEFS